MTTSDGNRTDSDAHSHGAADAHAHAHAVPALSEPHTPMWLPAVGALLFLTVGLAWALSTPPKELPDLSGMPAGSATASAAAAPAATPAATPAVTAAPAATPAPKPAATPAAPAASGRPGRPARH